MTHELVGVVVESTVTRQSAPGVVPSLLEPFCEDSNENGWWDWWCVGGRWTGVWIPGYEPHKDPRNLEERACFICHGSGQREDIGTMTREEYIAWCGGCNACRGVGRRVAFPSNYVPMDRDVLPVAELLDDETLRLPNRLVLPASGVISREDWDGKQWTVDPDWAEHARKALVPYREARIVAVDVHS